MVPAGAELTLEFCAQLCHDYNMTLSGAMYGRQCNCGNAFAMSPTKAPDDDCNMPCPGCSVKGACKAEGGKEMCGGSYRSSIFKVDCTGAPVPPPQPPPPPPPPSPAPPPPPCSASTSRAACYAAGVRCVWQNHTRGPRAPGRCIDRPPIPAGSSQLWAVRGSTLVSMQPDTPMCFGIPPGKDGTWNASDKGQRGELSNCSAAAAQFEVGLGGGTADAATGTLVHKASGLCLTVGRCGAPPPPAPPGPKPQGTHPCDIYASSGSPCVAAHSMVRALYAGYTGPLYAVQRASDNTSTNVSVLAAGSYADAKAQDQFCAGSDCVVSTLWDQSPNENHLFVFGAGDDYAGRQDKAANASVDPHTVNGHAVYALYTEGGMGYRTVAGAGKGVAVDDGAESMYAVFGGTHYNNHCCYDYGNAEVNAHGAFSCSCLYPSLDSRCAP